MIPHWKEILPIDRYKVQIKGILQGFDTKILTSLYQPLIGSEALSIYLTLWNEMDDYHLDTKESTHQSLMNMTQMKLSDIFLSRKKLEGIGLLKTYKKEYEQYRLYLYELQPPLKPERFFDDDVLNIYLYSRLGKHKFLELRKRFLKTTSDLHDFEVVTASFNEAFESIHQSELMTSQHSEIDETIKLGSNERFIQREVGDELSFLADNFDLDVMMQDLNAFIMPKEVIDDSMRKNILRLAFVYKIEPLEMSSIIQQAYMNNGELTISNLRKAVQDWYKFEFPNDLPALSERIEPLHKQTMQGKEAKTPQEKVIHLFETTSPRQLLERYSNGSKPAASDLKVIESIMLDQKLSPGVTNVLIDYVLITNDMKLIQAYVEKIASHWKRKKITTVEEAMTLAKSEHRKYQEWTTNKAKAQNNQGRTRKNTRKDKLPKWMEQTDLNEKQEMAKEEQQAKDTDQNPNRQAKEWLEDYLKDL